jgi:nicotinamidase-related amidase
MPTRTRFPRASTALLLIDVINPFDFPGGERFARAAMPAARRISRVAARARRAKVPVIYVNDNLGKWRSDMDALVAFCQRDGIPGAAITRLLQPAPDDYVVLKSTLSGFHQTPLEAMLRLGGVRTLVIAGFATDNCVFLTAADAYMRDFHLVVPRDAVAAKSRDAQRFALRQMRELFAARTPPSSNVRLRRA